MAMPAEDIRPLAEAIRIVPDFPVEGISFRDITPLLADGRLFEMAIDRMTSPWKKGDIDRIVGIDARGFIFGGAVALELGAGFVPIRKKGKLPCGTHESEYDLEYGTNTIAVHTDAVLEGERVILVDDLLATGGTAAAALDLLERLGADIVESVFLIELSCLEGRERLEKRPHPVRSVILD